MKAKERKPWTKKRKITAIILAVVAVALAVTLAVGNIAYYWWLYVYIDGKRIQFAMDNPKAEAGHVVFVGDSITDSCDLDRYYPGLGAYNRGIAGDVSEGILQRMDNSIYDLEPSLVVLLVGTNDYQRCPTHSNEHILANYRQILQQIHDNLPQTKVLVQSVYPIANVKYRTHYKYGHDQVIALNQALQILTDEFGYRYADVYPLLATEDNTMDMNYSIDGLHPNDAGFTIISAYLRPIIDEMLAA